MGLYRNDMTMLTVQQIARLQKLLNPNSFINTVKRIFGITIKRENLIRYISIYLQQQEKLNSSIADFIANKYEWFIDTDAQVVYNYMLAANIFSDSNKCFKIGNFEFCFTDQNLQSLQYVGIGLLVLFLAYNATRS